MNFTKIIETYWKTIVGVFTAFLVGATIVAVVNNKSTEKEKKAQEAYYSIEKKLIDLKAKKNPLGGADNKTETVDFTSVKKELEKFVTEYPRSIASQMAALHLASLLAGERNYDGALATLQKVETADKGLVNTLVQQQIGQLLADKEKCAEAIAVWQKVVDRKEAAFLHSEIKIQQALCYSKNKDFKKAEEILTNMANQSANPELNDSNSSKEAEKYLRLIQFKKASGT